VELAARHFGEVSGTTGAGVFVFVLSVRWTTEEPSGCWVVVSLVSVLELLPVAVVVVDSVWVVVVDFGAALLAHAAAPRRFTATKNAVVDNERSWLVMTSRHASATPFPR
jgi:hypothetical protein